MKFKPFGIMATAVLAIGLATGAILLNSNKDSFFSKGYASNHDSIKSLTINASDIANAIGEGDSGNFTVGGTEWAVSGASVSGGVVTIKGGTLYNVTLAGSTKTADNWTGSGFTSFSIENYDSKTGASAFGFNSSLTQVFFVGMGAITSNPFVQDLSAATDSVNRVQISFGAGDGTSFTSITYNYECEEATPKISLGINRNSFAVGETADLTASVKYVEDLSPVYSYSCSDNDVATVVGNGLTGTVTGAGAGTARITVTMTINAVSYTSYVDVTVTASVLYLEWDKTTGGPLYVDGAGMIMAVDCTSIGYSSNNELNGSLDSVSVVVTGKTVGGIVNFQQPGWAKANGLYVTFGSADYSGITAITVSIPHKTTSAIHTAYMEVTFSGTTPTITTLNGVDYATYMNS